MKKIINCGVTILTLVTLVFAGCKKEDPPIFISSTPVANAGNDTVIILPANSLLLQSIASEDERNKIVSYLWEVSGPSSVSIITSPYSASTIVQNLVKGTYIFKLTIKYKNGHTLGDEKQVIVWDPQYLNIKSVADTTIQLPYNRAYLREVGHYYNSVSSWIKISGPDSFSIPFPNSTTAVVSNLVEGVYKFKLTSTFWNQQTRIDTMTITVLPDTNTYTKEKLFDNRYSIEDDWGGDVIKIDISSIMPIGNHYKILFKKEATADWEIIIPSWFDFYDIYENSYVISDNYFLFIWTNRQIVNCQIKIVY